MSLPKIYYKENEPNKELLVCECGHLEHQLVFSLEQDGTVNSMIHLTRLSFWKRLKYGLRYIFGKQSGYGAFEEVIFTRDHLPKLKLIVKHLEKEIQFD